MYPPLPPLPAPDLVDGRYYFSTGTLEDYAREAIEIEREWCARAVEKVAQNYREDGVAHDVLRDAAKLIRGRTR